MGMRHGNEAWEQGMGMRHGNEAWEQGMGTRLDLNSPSFVHRGTL